MNGLPTNAKDYITQIFNAFVKGKGRMAAIRIRVSPDLYETFKSELLSTRRFSHEPAPTPGFKVTLGESQVTFLYFKHAQLIADESLKNHEVVMSET